jgi:hypothetical protein
MHYRNDIRVMSVTGWTHPLVTPLNVIDQPYFDGRAESWVWGTWARSWEGMLEYNALTLIQKCAKKDIDIYKYGADLVDMANTELKQNIWAVRFLYWHIYNNGLCLRPPWSMVEHIGYDDRGTNAQNVGFFTSNSLKNCPMIPKKWPEPLEKMECQNLWKKIYNINPTYHRRVFIYINHIIVKIKKFKFFKP